MQNWLGDEYEKVVVVVGLKAVADLVIHRCHREEADHIRVGVVGS